MTQYTVRPGKDGRFHVHARDGARIAGPFDSRDTADYHASSLDRDRVLLAVVEKPELAAGRWDGYAMRFRHTGDGRCAEERLLDWWLSLPEDGFIRARARIRVFDVTGRQWSIAGSEDSRVFLDPPDGATARERGQTQ